MLATVCSGQASPVRSQICASRVSLVLNMRSNTLESHSNLAQYQLYHGSLCRAYLVTVDHYSDFYEIDQLPTIQSSAVIQASK